MFLCRRFDSPKLAARLASIASSGKGSEVASLIDDHRRRVMFVEMALDDFEVAGVRPEQKVKGVADQRDCAERRIEPQITRHPPQFPFRHAKVACFPDEVSAHRGGDDIAQHRHQPDDSVEPDGAVDPRNDKAALEQNFEHLDPLAQRGGIVAIDFQCFEQRVGERRRGNHMRPFRAGGGACSLSWDR